MTVDLISEFLDAAEAVTPAVDRAMARAGVAFMAAGLPRYGIARIRPEADLYEPDEDGIPALLTTEWFGGIDCGALIEDIVATVLDHRLQSYRRIGLCAVLGDSAIAGARSRRMDLSIYRSPLSWLAAGGRGACLVDWTADPRYVFRGIPNLRCETDQLGRRLNARIAECSLAAPRISVQRPGYRCAA